MKHLELTADDLCTNVDPEGKREITHFKYVPFQKIYRANVVIYTSPNGKTQLLKSRHIKPPNFTEEQFIKTLRLIRDGLYSKPEDASDPCPECGKQLEPQWSGIKCLDDNCGYWFCY